MGFAPKPDDENGGPASEHHRHGGSGFRMGGGGPRGGGPGGYGGERGGRDAPMDDGDAASPAERQQMSAMRRAAAHPSPPVMIHLRFTNHGPSPAELLIADFLSPLGNFVVEPEKLVLAPGQTLEVEPMTSRLADEISGATVTLALRLAGRGEKKNIELALVPGPGPATPTEEKRPD